MLVVISILGILAALTVPALKNLGKSNAAISASRQMLEGLAARGNWPSSTARRSIWFLCRQIFGTTPSGCGNSRPRNKPRQCNCNLCDKQLSGYTFVAYGAVGDQPGQHAWHYLEPWHALPDGSFIASWKFTPPGPSPAMVRWRFQYLWIWHECRSVSNGGRAAGMAVLPCIAFNYLGQLTADGQNPASRDEYIPLARGSVLPAMDPSTKAFQLNSPSVSEMPPGNSTSSAFNLVDIDPLTGRATLRFQTVQ